VTFLVAGAAIALDSGVFACCGGCDRSGGSGDASAEAGSGGGCCGMGMRGGQDGHHENIHGLLDQHEAIKRQVIEIEGGVETVTTSEDPAIVEMIREHVVQMEQRVVSGQGLRWWDPTFAELFRHHEQIEMQIEEVPGGVRVRETSPNPDVAMLIRQHEKGVSEFVADGHARARQATPLPKGYNEGDEPESDPPTTP